jgi:uncharacterized protein YcnI
MRALQLSWPHRIATVGVVCAATILAGSPTALAHVSVNPGSVEPGEWATVSFHVPNERDDAATVRFEVVFPADRSVTDATPAALPGWTVTVAEENEKDTVSSVVWTGGQVQPGTYQEFPVSMAMPDEPGTLTFKALQTYATGEVVRWIDATEEGQPEPEHPAPTVTVARPAAPVAEQSTSDTVARVLGGAGLVAGLVAAGVAAVVTRQKRGTPVPTAPKREKARL